MFEQDAKEHVFGMFPTFNPSRDEYLIDFFKKAAEFGYNKGRNEAKEILQVVLDKWKEERWILQSEEEVRKIETLMEQAEQFLKDSEVEK